MVQLVVSWHEGTFLLTATGKIRITSTLHIVIFPTLQVASIFLFNPPDDDFMLSSSRVLSTVSSSTLSVLCISLEMEKSIRGFKSPPSSEEESSDSHLKYDSITTTQYAVFT